jgi:hypothetical protein
MILLYINVEFEKTLRIIILNVIYFFNDINTLYEKFPKQISGQRSQKSSK